MSVDRGDSDRHHEVQIYAPETEGHQQISAMGIRWEGDDILVPNQDNGDFNLQVRVKANLLRSCSLLAITGTSRISDRRCSVGGWNTKSVPKFRDID